MWVHLKPMLNRSPLGINGANWFCFLQALWNNTSLWNKVQTLYSNSMCFLGGAIPSDLDSYRNGSICNIACMQYIAQANSNCVRWIVSGWIGRPTLKQLQFSTWAANSSIAHLSRELVREFDWRGPNGFLPTWIIGLNRFESLLLLKWEQISTSKVTFY